MDKREAAWPFIRAVSEFIFAEDPPEASDVIFVPGGAEPEPALRAAELYREGFAPFVLPSGRYTKVVGHFAGVREDARSRYPGPYESEWAFLHDVLRSAGVPDAAILREDQATYTWDNAQRSRLVTDGAGIAVRRAILCCKPWHARRALMYYQAAYPEARLIVCPCSQKGENRDDWFLTAEGRARVLGEVARCGSQVGEVFAMMLEQSGTAGKK